MLRRIYACLLRLHPRRFRQRFEDQMLAVFDEAIRPQGALRLVIDAFVSMLRQWVLRPEYRSRPESPSLVGVNMSSLNELHKRSEQLQKKARRMNLAWAIGVLPLTVIVSVLVNHYTRTVAAELFYALVPSLLCLVLYINFSRCFARSAEEFVSIREASNFHRAELEREWDSLKMWSEQMGTVLLFTMLSFVSIPVFFSLLGRRPTAHSWLSVNLILFAIQTAFYFAVLKPLNRRAALALQEEICRIPAA